MSTPRIRDKIKVNQLLDLVIDDYRLQKRNSTYDTEKRIDKHLRPFFCVKRATEIGTKILKDYLKLRQCSDNASATISKEITWRRRGFNLGFEHEPKLVHVVPHFPMLPVDNVREGIIQHDVYRALRDLLPSYARVAFVISYHTGARKGEIRKIIKERVEFNEGRILLQRKTTKNKHPRYLPIYGDMAAEIEMAIDQGDPKCPFLIQRDGETVFDWEKSWRTACDALGLEGALFHDLRRTALTNMIDAGFSEKEAMEISGHKTRNVFDRYHIVSSKR